MRTEVSIFQVAEGVCPFAEGDKTASVANGDVGSAVARLASRSRRAGSAAIPVPAGLLALSAVGFRVRLPALPNIGKTRRLYNFPPSVLSSWAGFLCAWQKKFMTAETSFPSFATSDSVYRVMDVLYKNITDAVQGFLDDMLNPTVFSAVVTLSEKTLRIGFDVDFDKINVFFLEPVMDLFKSASAQRKMVMEAFRYIGYNMSHLFFLDFIEMHREYIQEMLYEMEHDSSISEAEKEEWLAEHQSILQELGRTEKEWRDPGYYKKDISAGVFMNRFKRFFKEIPKSPRGVRRRVIEWLEAVLAVIKSRKKEFELFLEFVRNTNEEFGWFAQFMPIVMNPDHITTTLMDEHFENVYQNENLTTEWTFSLNDTRMFAFFDCLCGLRDYAEIWQEGCKIISGV